MPDTYAFLMLEESSHLRKTSGVNITDVIVSVERLTHERTECQKTSIHLSE